MKFSIFPNAKETRRGELCTAEVFDRLTNSPECQQCSKLIFDAVKEGNEDKQMKYKKMLPCVTWQAYFPDGERKAEKAVPSGLYMLDIDHVEDVKKITNEALKRRAELGLVLISVTSSGKGVRLVAECRPEHSTIEEAQRWLSEQMGVEFDAVCKDWARCDFRPYSSHAVVWMDYGLFVREPKHVFVNLSSPQAPMFASKTPSVEIVRKYKEEKGVEPGSALGVQGEYKGLKLSEISREWLNATGGEPERGERNTKLYRLATRLRYICDFNEEVMLSNMPRYGLGEEEMRQLIRSANNSMRAVSIPSDMQEVIDKMVQIKALGGKEETSDEFATLNDTSTIPELPPVFREWFDIAPDDFKIPVTLCQLPILGTLGSRLRGVYADGSKHSPTFQVSLEAPQASGKSFIRKLVDYELKAVKEHDEVERARERAYQDKVKEVKLLNTKVTKANQENILGTRPQTLVRYVPPTMSITQMLIRMNNAKGLHLFAMAEEIDTVTKAFKKGISSYSDALRCSFDNAEYGQDYASENSFSGMVKLFYNVLFSGTPKAMKRFYPDVEDGLVSRVTFVTLPDQFGKEMPQWGVFDEVQKQSVDLALARLNDVSIVGDDVQPEHDMELEWLATSMMDWVKEQQRFAVKTDNRTRDVFCRRCGVVGFRAGMIAFYLWGEEESKQEAVVKFAQWIANLMLKQQCSRFDLNDSVENAKNWDYYKGLFDSMGKTFSKRELEAEAAQQGITSPIRTIVYLWRKIDSVTYDEANQVYHKKK